MYRDVVVYDSYTGLNKSYTVTNTENQFNGYTVPRGVNFYTYNEGNYTPTRYRTEFNISKSSTKPSIYKRDWFQCYKDEYKYQFTEKTTRTVETSKDVYYNAPKDRFITRSKNSSYKTKVEYNLPSIILW